MAGDDSVAPAATAASDTKISVSSNSSMNVSKPQEKEQAEKAEKELEKPSRASDTITAVSKDTSSSSNASAEAPTAPPTQPLVSDTQPPPVPAATGASDSAVAAAKAQTATQASTTQKPTLPVNLSSAPKLASAPPPPPSTLGHKRKLSTSPPPPGTAPQPPPTQRTPGPSSSTRPLVDPLVTKSVHDIMGLLQTYGPLSFAQLEYNLPPTNTLQDVLQVMVTLGAIQVVDDGGTSNEFTPSTRYCMAYGKPRADIVSPSQLVEDIAEAQVEIQSSQERCDLLKQALLDHASTKSINAREILKRVLFKYPQIVNDPVYMAAFRNTHVDVAAVERDRLKHERSMAEKKNEKANAKNDEESSESMEVDD